MSNEEIFLRIFGEPASKSNSRRLILRGNKPRIIKSNKALQYADLFRLQVRIRPNLLEGDLSISMIIFYYSRRPDLDESLILDLLQGRIFHNDRQIKEKHIYHRLDKTNPRTEIIIKKII